MRAAAGVSLGEGIKVVLSRPVSEVTGAVRETIAWLRESGHL